MNQHLQNILNTIQQDKNLSEEERNAIIKSLKNADKEFEITNFKLDRTEKVKRTTAILLEETIEELEHKRKAVEAQNRELEIESSLERVRTVAMSMNHRDDMLLVCRTISEQLEILNIKEIRNVQTAIFYEEKGTYMNYEYYAKHNKTFITETIYTDHEIANAFAKKMLKGKGEISVTLINGEEKVKEWLDYQKGTNVFIDTFLETAISLNYYWFSLGPLALGISTYAALSDAELNLFKRFINVFELAYRRYLDIEKAAAQAKEAQLETSLERVRAQAMAMRTPEDLAGICEVLYAELNTLGFDAIRNAMINIYDDEKKTFVNYDYSDDLGKSINHLRYNSHPVIEKQIKELRSAGDAFSEAHFKGKDLDDWKTFRKEIGEKDDPRIDKADALYYYFYSIGIGSIGISTFSMITEEKLNVLKRFRNVFNLSYQRYTDIALAEAQAKEARIETALERVRAIAMAMRNPGDLSGISETLFTELKALGFADLRNAEVIINNDKNGTIISYYYSDYGRTGVLEMDYKTNPVVHKWADDLRKADDAFAEVVIPGKDLPEWEKFAQSAGYLPDKKLDKAKAIYYYSYSIGLGALSISSFTAVPKEYINILGRFSNVFNLSYQRYTDITLALAQAKEARIETALERVRAVAMAMKKSEELVSVCEVMFKELTSLGFTNIRNAQIAIENDERQSYTFYVYSEFEKLSGDEVGINSSPMIQKIYQNLGKSENAFYEREYNKTEMKEWRSWRKSLAPLHDPREETADSMCWYLYAIGKGHIGISTFNAITKEQIEIVKRFKTVFELSYKRFDDLQKAEAQSREAQIQLALERVRARTMAMQKSDELSETAVLLFQQLKSLGFDLRGCGFNIWEKAEKTCTAWMSGPEGALSQPFNLPLTEDPLFIRYYESRQKGEDLWVYETTKEELAVRYKYLQTLPVLGELLAKERKDGIETPLPPFIIDHVVNFSNGNLIFITNKQHPEAWDIFKRFGIVFEQTYTRFLDLQKAEAQVREAQIEAALEKVRSRSLAVHNSDEFKEVIKIVFEKLSDLDIRADAISINIFIEGSKDTQVYICSQVKDKFDISHFRLIYFDHPISNDRYWAQNSGLDFFTKSYSFEEKNSFYKFEFEVSDLKYVSESLKNLVFESKSYNVSWAIAKHSMIVVNDFEGNTLTEKEIDVVKRFSKVFEQAYIRFLDLQKAEAQSREAQIQLALERARTQSMIMQHSNELDDTLRVFHEQVLLLGIPSAFSFLWLPDEKKDQHIFWAAWKENTTGLTTFKSKAINYSLDRNEPATAQCLLDWKSDEPVHSYAVPAAEVENYFVAWGELFGGVEHLKPGYFPGGLHYVEAFMKYGCFGVMVENELSEDQKKILLRFAIEFERTYTRFLDLQKAESQTREAQIEVSLERVRAKAMSMHRSEDLHAAVAVVFEELEKLQLGVLRCGISVLNKENRCGNVWLVSTDGDKAVQVSGDEPFDIHPLLHGAFEAWLKQEDFYYVLEGEDLAKYYKAVKNAEFMLPESQMLVSETHRRQYCFVAVYNSGGLFAFQETAFTEEAKKIMRRFAAVFDLTYKRFLDLQKAEAQAREAKIETALERVRSKAMAMHSSEDLGLTVESFFSELNALDVTPRRCGVGIIDRETKIVDIHANTDTYQNKIKKITGKLKLSGHPVLDLIFENWISQKEYHPVLHGNEILEYYKVMNPQVTFPDFAGDETQYGYYFFFKEGGVFAWSDKELLEETLIIFRRFTSVLSLTYRRYMDLKEAEAQAREAKIEASLERVRSKAMSMQKSEDLAEAINIVFEELDKRNLGILRCGIGILNKEKRTADVWTTTIADNNTVVQVSGDESMDIHPLLSGTFDAQLNQENFSYTLKGEDLTNYYKAVAGGNFKLPDSQSLVATTENMTQYYYNAVWSSGGLFAFSESPFSQEAKMILNRFADVFTLTYTRFSDLKQAEAQAKEAKIEVALERVRSRTLAMQRSDELAETAAVMFQQLITLGIEPNRLYIAIAKDDTGNTEFWITDEDGSKVSSAFETNLNDNATFRKMFDGWREGKKSLVINMQGKDLQEYFKYLTSIKVPFKGGLTQKRRVQDIAYFSNGFIGMASPEEQPVETLQLLERFAYVFNLTFTRFNDLKLAEAHAIQAELDLIAIKEAKQKAEATLTELQATQTQLIQSEKMASLGELTAGIAHEIQNPLNFVNNFSEVSVELIKEMVDEVNKGNSAEAKEIAHDLVQNLEKITHHGKRADAIVKGMLQHSRTTSAIKEPTDINKLTDEYLRLAYHGLRAKDKSFNATLKTDFDDSIGKVSIIPQDIGRVILNLITNAFYVVGEKKKLNIDKYEPTVSVITKKINNKVEIKVSDNGNGIPTNILDKIFQPFFTTKPTGQGTGLGLSLAYDIVKAHGGELKVETKENEGSAFIILLPTT